MEYGKEIKMLNITTRKLTVAQFNKNLLDTGFGYYGGLQKRTVLSDFKISILSKKIVNPFFETECTGWKLE